MSFPSPELLDRVQADIDRRGSRRVPSLGRHWKGADSSRPGLKNWSPVLASADEHNEPDREKMIARGLDLERNEPIVSGAVLTSRTNIVGSGLTVQACMDSEEMGLPADQVLELQRIAEKDWRNLADTYRVDFDQTQTFGEMTNTVLQGLMTVGDIFAVRRFDPSDQDLGLRVQLIEGTRCSNPRGLGSRGRLKNGRRVVGGVEHDFQGRPVAYWFRDEARPGRKQTWTRVPRYGSSGQLRVIHVYEKLRPGQTRGMPLISAIIEPAKILGRTFDARLLREAVKSLFTVAFKTEGAAPLTDQLFGTQNGTRPNDPGEYQLGSGAQIHLKTGESVDLIESKMGGDDFEAFVEAVAQHLGAAIGIPAEVLLHSYKSSYSASRAALQDAWRLFRCRRSFLVDKFCKPVWGWAIENMVIAQRLKIPGFFDNHRIRAAASLSRWDGPAEAVIDEVKNVTAAKLRMEELLSNPYIECARLGVDFEVVAEGAAKAQELLGRLGLQVTSRPAQVQVGVPFVEDEEQGSQESGDDDEAAGDREDVEQAERMAA